MPRVALYAGSFDPITNGHSDLIRRSLSFVDRLVVAVASNVSKQTLFTPEERTELIRAAVENDPRVTVQHFQGLTVDFAKKSGVLMIIRGLRAASDFEYEYQMALMNRHLAPEMETVFMVPSLDTTYISSSLVREVARFHGDISSLVHPSVEAALAKKISEDVSFLTSVCARASKLGARVAFGEAGDRRVLDAAVRLAKENVATPVLVTDPADAAATAAARATGLECLDPSNDARAPALAGALLASRAKHGMLPAEAEKLSHDPLAFATWLVKTGAADASVGGAVRTTRELMHFALWLIGPAEGVRTVSSAFYMVVPPFRGGESEVLTFTDCSVVPNPTAPQLADIAVSAAAARRKIVGDVPRIALLSYSTKGSGGDGPSIAIVQAALTLIKARAPELIVDGDLQADAALIADVGARKAAGSVIAGNANVLVFPNLDAGNIAYKLTERLAHAKAIGPILQGLAMPVSDLSRGADSDAIFHVAAITALQSSRFHMSGDQVS